jgi:hypothetical protein
VVPSQGNSNWQKEAFRMVPELENATPEEWVEQLLAWADQAPEGTALPDSFSAAVHARPAELGPHLARLIGDEALWDSTAPGKGYVPALAAELAGDVRYEGAVTALLKVAEHVQEFTQVGDAAVFALLAIGEPARAGLLDLAERYCDDVESMPFARAVEVLAQLPKDDRTWRHLRRGLEEATEMTGLYISLSRDFGDQRAVYHLNRLLEERADLTPLDVQEAMDSIDLLGGIPTAKAVAAAAVGREERLATGKVGRNDPCPCGSGIKYKKCCGK